MMSHSCSGGAEVEEEDIVRARGRLGVKRSKGAMEVVRVRVLGRERVGGRRRVLHRTEKAVEVEDRRGRSMYVSLVSGLLVTRDGAFER